MYKLPTDQPYVETETYEFSLPGRIIGKPVIDAKQKMIGIVRNIRIRLPPGEIQLVIKGLDVELSVSQADIVAIGGVVQLKTEIIQAEEIDMSNALRLREELREEMDILMTNFIRKKN